MGGVGSNLYQDQELKYLLFLPFSYFFITRLSRGSISFHLFFEWFAAFVLVVTLGDSGSWVLNSSRALICYLSFISLYEIGYIANDIYDVSKGEFSRRRLPSGANVTLVGFWVISRLSFFLLGTEILGAWQSMEWWSFFVTLSILFALHNTVIRRELKVISFVWLAWYRFMAPIIFVVAKDQVFGISFAVAIGYVIFRYLSYLDSKDALRLPERRSNHFRVIFFMFPLFSIGLLVQFPSSSGYIILTAYWSAISLIGGLFLWCRGGRAAFL